MVEVNDRGASLGRKQPAALIGHLQHEAVLIAPLPRYVSVHFIICSQEHNVFAFACLGFGFFPADA
jgi:hypothetical protein